MARDFFAALGLRLAAADTSRRPISDPRVVAASYETARAAALARLHDPAQHAAARRMLEDLYVAYRLLADPQRQQDYLSARAAGDRAGELRALIGAALEDGLLRHSRRQMIVAHATELGYSEFQAQLLIAQVMFGDADADVAPRARPRTTGIRGAATGLLTRVAAVGLLALGLFFLLVGWLGR